VKKTTVKMEPKVESAFGWHRRVQVDGRTVCCSVTRDRKVRIPFKPRGPGAFGWRYSGSVRDSETGECLFSGRVVGTLGVRGLLKRAGLYPLAVEKCWSCGGDGLGSTEKTACRACFGTGTREETLS
jgi:hypothetical protein